MTTPFRTVELDIIDPISGVASDIADGHGTLPHGTQSRLTQALETVSTLRYSDLGYVREDHVSYPPFVSQAFDLDRGLSLSATGLGASSSYGSLTFLNPTGLMDAVLTGRINDRLPVRINRGLKTPDPVRGLLKDPSSDTLQPLFSGLGRNWRPDHLSATVELLDATSWLDRSMTVSTYGGTGRLDGDSNVAGRNRPRLRGTVCNVTPVLIDATNYVYQVSDGPVDITALYEGGYAGGITFAADVEDIYAVSPPAGTWSRQVQPNGTWIRLGSRPVYQITLDAFGHFPSGAAPDTVLDILRQMLIEDIPVPHGTIDASWPVTSDLAPWSAGWYWDGSSSETGTTITQTLLSGLGLTLVSTRRGTLRPVRLQIPDPDTVPVLSLTPDLVSAISAVGLSAPFDVPAWRWRVGWQHNFTVTTGTALHPQSSADRQALVAVADRNAVWLDMRIKAQWRQPSDPDAVITALSRQDDAQTIATLQGRLWATSRQIWAVTVPETLGLHCDLGDIVSLSAPVPGLRQAVLGIVMAEHLRAGDSTMTLQLLTITEELAATLNSIILNQDLTA
ncbi:hypothetical protein JRX38_00940 [Gluconobacter cerinus]|uniref:hypothetical protein n=1 Tax=Gluconobacter cerinus TaxID=38307 RepID=UPI00193F32EF|nr:hypothetical protein [Gluconobacter cerinus]MBM3096600.1 hypothetical protein [Gluconobacter cerinus]